MTLENILNISNEVELARVEEKLSKLKAKQLFNRGFLDNLKAGSFQALAEKA